MCAFFYYAVKSPEDFKNAVIRCDLEKLELFGDDYILDFVFSCINEKNKETIYRIYVTDVLKTIAEATVRLGRGEISLPRYADLIEPKQKKQEMSAEEIVEQVTRNAGLKVIEK